ncbi:sensor histidine kinase [Pseudonocardia acaciae]|uniref:sensor histidine kinase n=1 Tax=Pseudonocardia acaciae TaxID=551276 RepID=UPI00048BB47B|nr:nitrate- and nitrite sensing domain-containing protein [Pseudonocardia acaciae]
MSAPEDPPPGRAWLLPGNWSLPVKLAAVLTVPIVLAMTLGALRVSDRIDDATALDGQARYLTVRDSVTTLVAELQRERYHAAVYVAGKRDDDSPPPQGAFAATDKRSAEAASAVGDATALGDGPRAAYAQVIDELTQLAALREQVADAPAAEASSVIARYSGLIGALLRFEAALDRRLSGGGGEEYVPAAAGLPLDLTTLAAAAEQVAVQQVVIAAATIRGELTPPDADTVRAADTRLATAAGQLWVGMADGRRKLLHWAESDATAPRQQLKQAALGRAGARGVDKAVDRGQWDAANGAVLADLRGTEAGVRAELGSIAVAWQERARGAAGLDSVLLLLGLLATAGVVYGVGRSMLTPLRVLRRTAMEVANRRLPNAVRAMREGRTPAVTVKPVPVTSTEEIGQVARAFDAVHGQAVRLAAEQATLQTSVSGMFVNLSRRSQGLVERQLRLIERLERNEQDAEQLDNLFKLDHLATRMRRNSENLLILAGSEVTNRPNQTVPVVDVLRAAVSEIEQYKRVVVRTSPDALILGRAAKDLMHLVAELLDNATNFSPPDTQVVLDSNRTSDGSVLVEIADEGVGMTANELSAANRRLSGTAELDVSTSRRMGLFVVGRLAARHRIKVRLAASERSLGARAGITAFVHVLPDLVTAPTATDRGGGEAPAARRGPAWSEPAQRPSTPSKPPPAPASPVTPVTPVTAAVNGADPLTDERPPPFPSEPAPRPPDPEETPIYTRMESAWFRSGGGRELFTERSEAAATTSATASATASDPLRPMPEAAETQLTASGLPKRTPRAQLIPRGGGDNGAVQPPEVPARRPERTRGLLASYQEGLRQGRAGTWRATPLNVPSRPGGEQG